MRRASDLGFLRSRLPPGPDDAITDVAGVAVGHFTLIADSEMDEAGHGTYRTGVTVILPHQGNLYEESVPAAVHTINGYGKPIGFEQVRELGSIETPIALTGTLNVPRVADALITVAIEQNPLIGSVNPLVAETNDGFLSDIQGRPIGEPEVRAALASAMHGPVREGVVGAGTGTSCFSWKGGIGTASRVIPARHTVGALVQSNFGAPHDLTIAGVPIGLHLLPPGRHLQPPGKQRESLGGSIVIVLATDAPLETHCLERLAKRVDLALARTGSVGHNGSGDFVIAFSTGYRIPRALPPAGQSGPRLVPSDSMFNDLSLAVVESVEEAIYNSLFAAHTVVGRGGNTRHALPLEEVVAIIEKEAGSIA